MNRYSHQKLAPTRQRWPNDNHQSIILPTAPRGQNHIVPVTVSAVDNHPASWSHHQQQSPQNYNLPLPSQPPENRHQPNYNYPVQSSYHQPPQNQHQSGQFENDHHMMHREYCQPNIPLHNHNQFPPASLPPHDWHQPLDYRSSQNPMLSQYHCQQPAVLPFNQPMPQNNYNQQSYELQPMPQNHDHLQSYHQLDHHRQSHHQQLTHNQCPPLQHGYHAAPKHRPQPWNGHGPLSHPQIPCQLQSNQHFSSPVYNQLYRPVQPVQNQKIYRAENLSQTTQQLLEYPSTSYRKSGVDEKTLVPWSRANTNLHPRFSEEISSQAAFSNPSGSANNVVEYPLVLRRHESNSLCNLSSFERVYTEHVSVPVQAEEDVEAELASGVTLGFTSSEGHADCTAVINLRGEKEVVQHYEQQLRLVRSENESLHQRVRHYEDMQQRITTAPPSTESYEMNMVPHGIAVIINNFKNFYSKDPTLTAKPLPNRRGSHVDEGDLVRTWNRLGYVVRVLQNLTASDLVCQLKQIAAESHKSYDSFVCCVLSHGCLNGVYGIDSEPVDIEKIADLFKGNNCPTLIGKPKLFFIQACRGDSEDEGISFETDGKDPVQRAHLPNNADFLFGYATSSGNVSWRNPKEGSWYIRQLCEVLFAFSTHRDLLSMLTIVNYRVSMASTPHGNMQCPAPVSQLRKQVWFFRKA